MPALAGRCSSFSPTPVCGSANARPHLGRHRPRPRPDPRPPPAHPPPRPRAAQNADWQARGDPRPAIAKLLREHWLASPFKAPHHLVWCNSRGRGLDYRDIGEDFRATLKRAGITASSERLTLHSLRHGFASLLIANGLNVVFVSRQLGHANANVNVTLEVYAHLFERANHADTARAALDASHAAVSQADA